MRDLFEPWSYRRLEGRTGLGRSSLQTKFGGSVPFTLGDIEILAPIVRMTAVELATELYSIHETQKTPTANGEGVSLPRLDSNQQPAGAQLAPVTRIAPTSDGAETGIDATITRLFG